MMVTSRDIKRRVRRHGLVVVVAIAFAMTAASWSTASASPQPFLPAPGLAHPAGLAPDPPVGKATDVGGAMTVTVLANRLNVRSGPGTKYKVIGSAKKWTHLVALCSVQYAWAGDEGENPWYRVEVAGQRGYIDTSWIVLVDHDPPPCPTDVGGHLTG